MTQKQFHSIVFPPSRHIVVDSGYLANSRHIVYGLLEFDVTTIRAFIHDHKAETGEKLSFTAYMVACLAQAVKDNPLVQAYRSLGGRLVIFDTVDVVTLIELEHNQVAIPHIIRSANQKSFYEIHKEIRAIQSRERRSEQQLAANSWVLRLPRFLRLPIMRLAFKNPHLLQRYAGTVVLSSIGMFGQGAGWALSFLPMHSMGITLGGIGRKPAIVDGQLVEREYVSVTLSFDHDVVDGAPAARFAQCFRELVEAGALVHDMPSKVAT